MESDSKPIPVPETEVKEEAKEEMKESELLEDAKDEPKD